MPDMIEKPEENGNPDLDNQEAQKPKRYYGSSALILLACNIIYWIPHLEHYLWGGIQGMAMLFVMGIFTLVADIIFLFIVAAILRKVMSQSWGKYFKRAGLGLLAVFLAVNIYRSTLPLPYLQYMIDQIPSAVEYFEQHEEELYAMAGNDSSYMTYYPDKGPSGPMVNIFYVYVESPGDYPQEVGQLSRTKYIHPIDEHWYLLLYQGAAH